MSKITHADLAQFTGSEHVYRHGLLRSITYTEGVQYLAEKAAAYWLIDAVASYQHEAPVKGEEFQVWRLKVEGSRAVLTCEDGNERKLVEQQIEFTDFPLDHIDLWVENGVILLPSEH
ncbi:DUF6876 family protein [Bradyrhizobium sp. BRP23]|uniref:DUF6876 family protein n=1 Tax=Bradyrhizobium sp. BRP23 TaxID=2793820 RepID=UPI001CD59559|nr:DUF6876 family protein [Bradyrhizobium sp. BRP23]MCA1419475.1 hypothetical protein [Bradyrhizobium sp. BRP23]